MEKKNIQPILEQEVLENAEVMVQEEEHILPEEPVQEEKHDQKIDKRPKNKEKEIEIPKKKQYVITGVYKSKTFLKRDGEETFVFGVLGNVGDVIEL